LREDAQPQEQSTQAARQAHIIAQKERQKEHPRIEADSKDKLADWQNRRPSTGGRARR